MPSLVSDSEARVELDEVRSKVRRIDADSGGKFFPALRAVLNDPVRSVEMPGGSYRLPAGAGAEGVLAFLPKMDDPREQEEQYALDARRSVRSVLFLSQP